MKGERSGRAGVAAQSVSSLGTGEGIRLSFLSAALISILRYVMLSRYVFREPLDCVTPKYHGVQVEGAKYAGLRLFSI